MSELKNNPDKKLITVLVAFRNEEKVIHHLVHSLGKVDYPSENLEVIFIDDHSEDNSNSVVKSLIYDRSNYNLVRLHESKAGKKSAINQGVELAKGEIIVTTDADCEVPVNWLNKINDSFNAEEVNMALGGVRLKTSKSFFSSLQAIEFSSLIGSMAASLGFGSFVMGNGANLSFRKAAFQYVNGFEGNLDIASGDDEFLARKILKSFPGSVRFINAQEAVVSSRPMATVRDFIEQRIRWAGKWKYNITFTSGVLALYVLLVQLAYLIVVMSLLHVREGTWLLVSILMLKGVLECWFLFKVSTFLQSKWNWAAFLLWQFIYPFYVLGIGIFSQVRPYTWKGRRLSH